MESLKQLQTEWYARLKRETDFDDIEDSRHQDRPLKSWHNLRFKNQTNIKETTQYYDEAIQLFYDYPFKNTTERCIWAFHCQGCSQRQIEKMIQGFQITYKRQWIQMIINRVKRSMK